MRRFLSTGFWSFLGRSTISDNCANVLEANEDQRPKQLSLPGNGEISSKLPAKIFNFTLT